MARMSCQFQRVDHNQLHSNLRPMFVFSIVTTPRDAHVVIGDLRELDLLGQRLEIQICRILYPRGFLEGPFAPSCQSGLCQKQSRDPTCATLGCKKVFSQAVVTPLMKYGASRTTGKSNRHIRSPHLQNEYVNKFFGLILNLARRVTLLNHRCHFIIHSLFPLGQTAGKRRIQSNAVDIRRKLCYSSPSFGLGRGNI